MIVKQTHELLAFFTDTSDKNLAFHVPSKKEDVELARKKLAKKYDFNISSLAYMDQIHSSFVKVADPNRIYQCDGLITNKKNTPLMVMVADCIPILFFDMNKKAIGVAHAGRAGTFENIANTTIEKLIQTYSCDPRDIKVILGPSIHKCCYEVSNQIAQFTKGTFGDQFVNDRYIDLQGINKMQLLQSGVLEENISTSQICTKCGSEPYFSYRKDQKCGRFAGVILLK